jgi:hypothetical protein
MNDAMRQCIRDCVDCHSVCLQSVTDCLEIGGRSTRSAGTRKAHHIRLLLDCAAIC